MEDNTEYESPLRQEIDLLNQRVMRVRTEVGKALVGQENTVDLILAAIFTGGHILLEGVPGIAKTLTAKLIAKTLSVGFSRIQFTPDLMPSDVLGTTIFNPKTAEFQFKQGPIFSNIVLIDEINRAPAKTQSALFEVMEERQVTIDGITHAMDFPFIVLATQNPLEQEGTYRLPEAQLDRFLFKIDVQYPSLAEEISILTNQHVQTQAALLDNVQKILSPQQIAEYRLIIHSIIIEPKLVEFIAKIVNQTRNNSSLYLGASPRASLAIMRASKANAAIKGRDFVSPEDILEIAGPVMRHRIILTPEKEMEGMTPDELIETIVKNVEIPR
jgi:MoxR-like ATPase